MVDPGTVEDTAGISPLLLQVVPLQDSGSGVLAIIQPVTTLMTRIVSHDKVLRSCLTDEVDDVVDCNDGVAEELHHHGQGLGHLPGVGPGGEDLGLVDGAVGGVSSRPDTASSDHDLACPPL